MQQICEKKNSVWVLLPIIAHSLLQFCLLEYALCLEDLFWVDLEVSWFFK